MIFVLPFLALVKSVVFSFFGLNFFDYGESLHNGVRLLEGATLYKDVWAIFPPADNYFPALVLAMTNDHLLALRYAQSILFTGLVAVIILLSRNFLQKKFLILMAIALVFSNLNIHLLFFQFFFLTAILFFLNFWKTEEKKWMLLSGIMIGIGALFRHDTAIAAGATVVSLALLISRFAKRRLDLSQFFSKFSLGALAVVGPIFVWMISIGVLDDFLYLGFIRAPLISRILSPGFNVMEVFSPPFTYRKGFAAFTFLRILPAHLSSSGALFISQTKNAEIYLKERSYTFKSFSLRNYANALRLLGN